MTEGLFTNRFLFYSILEFLHETLDQASDYALATILLIVTNGLSAFMTFQGIKSDDSCSSILGNMAAFSVVGHFVGSASAVKDTFRSRKVEIFVWTLLVSVFILINMCFFLGQQARITAFAMLTSLRIYESLATKKQLDGMGTFYVAFFVFYFFFLVYLLLYILPKPFWSIIYAMVGSLFFCYTIERMFRLNCGIFYLLEMGKSEFSTENGLNILYMVTLGGILLQLVTIKIK